MLRNYGKCKYIFILPTINSTRRNLYGYIFQCIQPTDTISELLKAHHNIHYQMQLSVCMSRERDREIKFIGLFEDRGHRGPYSPYEPFNHNLYIGIIIFPHIDNPQSTGCMHEQELQKLYIWKTIWSANQFDNSLCRMQCVLNKCWFCILTSDFFKTRDTQVSSQKKGKYKSKKYQFSFSECWSQFDLHFYVTSGQFKWLLNVSSDQVSIDIL